MPARTLKWICGWILLIAFMGGCQPQAGEKLVLTGSSTVAPLMSEIAKQFEREHPGIRVDVQRGGSSRGMIDTRKGLADIGMVSRALKDTESDLHGFEIARDGVCMIVHRDNPIDSLTDAQIVKIYSGEIKRWSEVQGDDAAITVVNKAEGRSTLELFLKYFQLESTQIKPSVVIGDNQQGIKTVAGNPFAIGYVSIGDAESSARSGVPIKLLPIGGIRASTENVANGTFPLSRPLTLVTREEPTGITEQLINYARSQQVKPLIEELNFVPPRS